MNKPHHSSYCDFGDTKTNFYICQMKYKVETSFLR